MCPCTYSSSNSVDVTSAEAFVQSDGPWRFTRYCLVLIGIGIAGCLVFAPFLPVYMYTYIYIYIHIYAVYPAMQDNIYNIYHMIWEGA
jgi:hypothetical protein